MHQIVHDEVIIDRIGRDHVRQRCRTCGRHIRFKRHEEYREADYARFPHAVMEFEDAVSMVRKDQMVLPFH